MVGVSSPPMERIDLELVNFIARKTGLDRKTIVSVLEAEEDFLTLQITRKLVEGGER
ncbi:hypothetical protein [Thermococcus gammatolerans]|uniref:hypothetical protein n=1 Tax=Thermococcus gammatolerans TaxID=187878 RepID=UPI00145F1743|nr:hypothetical protein [Thermococcus gammatolerans]